MTTNLSRDPFEASLGDTRAWVAQLARAGKRSAQELLDRGAYWEQAGDFPSWLEAGPPKMCFKNAAELSMLDGFDYCEGYARSASMAALPMAHAWCTDAAGQVVDPTWANGSDYFGIQVDQNELCRILVTTRTYGVLDADEFYEERT